MDKSKSKKRKLFWSIIILLFTFSASIIFLSVHFSILFKKSMLNTIKIYKDLLSQNLKFNIDKNFQTLNTLLNSYAVWDDLYKAVKNNNYTFFNEIWTIDHEVAKCDSYGIIKENGKVFLSKNPILSSSQIKTIIYYMKTHVTKGQEYTFFDFFIRSSKDNNYYFVAVSPLSSTQGYVLSYDILYFSKKLKSKPISKILHTQVKIKNKKEKNAFIVYPLKNITNNTIGYINLYFPTWIQSNFEITQKFLYVSLTIIYVFALILGLVTIKILKTLDKADN